MNAACSGCNVSPLASPSIVVISAPSCIAASVRQALTRLPFNRTVHAPHAPALQPFFVPVRSSVSRRTSSRDWRGSSARVCARPLTVRLMVWLFMLTFLSPVAPYPGDSGSAANAAAPAAPWSASLRVIAQAAARAWCRHSVSVPDMGCHAPPRPGIADLGPGGAATPKFVSQACAADPAACQVAAGDAAEHAPTEPSYAWVLGSHVGMRAVVQMRDRGTPGRAWSRSGLSGPRGGA